MFVRARWVCPRRRALLAVAAAGCILASWLAAPSDAHAQTPVTGLVEQVATTVEQTAAPIQPPVRQAAEPARQAAPARRVTAAAKAPATTVRTTPQPTVATAPQPVASTVRTTPRRSITAAQRRGSAVQAATKRTAAALETATKRTAASFQTATKRLGDGFEVTRQLAVATILSAALQTAGDLQQTAQRPAAGLVAAGGPAFAAATAPRLDRNAPSGRVAGATAAGVAQPSDGTPSLAAVAATASGDAATSGWRNRRSADAGGSQAAPGGTDTLPATQPGLSIAAAAAAGTAAIGLLGLLALLFIAASQLSSAVRLRAATAPLTPFLALSGRPG